jgi:uncharacterized membrane protein (DUF106 family)
MTNSTDPKATNSGQRNGRASDQWVSFQLIATFVTVVAGILTVQWQIGTLVSYLTTKLTTSSMEIKALKEDVAELKETTKELSRNVDSLKTRSPYKLRQPENDDLYK